MIIVISLVLKRHAPQIMNECSFVGVIELEGSRDVLVEEILAVVLFHELPCKSKWKVLLDVLEGILVVHCGQHTCWASNGIMPCRYGRTYLYVLDFSYARILGQDRRKLFYMQKRQGCSWKSDSASNSIFMGAKRPIKTRQALYLFPLFNSSGFCIQQECVPQICACISTCPFLKCRLVSKLLRALCGSTSHFLCYSV